MKTAVRLKTRKCYLCERNMLRTAESYSMCGLYEASTIHDFPREIGDILRGHFILICRMCEKQFSHIQQNIRQKTFAKYEIDVAHIERYNAAIRYAREIIKKSDSPFVNIKKRKISEVLDIDSDTDNKIKELSDEKPIESAESLLAKKIIKSNDYFVFSAFVMKTLSELKKEHFEKSKDGPRHKVPLCDVPDDELFFIDKTGKTPS